MRELNQRSMKTHTWQRTVSVRAERSHQLAVVLIEDLKLIRRVYQPPRLTQRFMDKLKLDLLTFLADTLIDSLMYAFYVPEASPAYGGHIVPALWIYRIRPSGNQLPPKGAPTPLIASKWEGAHFDVFVEFSEGFLRYPPQERSRRLASFNLPWRPNELTLIMVREPKVDMVKSFGDLTLYRSHYDVTNG